MNLKEYRESKQISQTEAALQIGTTKDVYVSWECRKRIPRSENMENIVAWSNGEVTPNDFYNLEIANDNEIPDIIA